MKLVVTSGYNKGEIIRIIREWTGLTQKEFAKRIGRSESTVRAYESSSINYSIDMLLHIAKVFDLEIAIEKKKKR